MSAGGPGIVDSTTRAPSDSSRPTHASAASLASVSRPSARFGALRRRPTVSPSRRGSGTRATGEHRPEDGDVAHRRSPSARPCRTTGRAERRRRSGRRRAWSSARRARTRPRAAGPSSRCRCRARGRRDRAASAAAFPLDEPPVVRPGLSRVVHRPVPLVRPEHAPRELDEVRLADDRPRPRRARAARPSHGARARGRRRAASRRSS